MAGYRSNITNVFEELQHINVDDIEAITITLGWEDDATPLIQIHNPTIEQIAAMKQYDYDSVYGSQELYGTIWMKDGTWYAREEYDGSEWWKLYSRPDLLF